MLPAGGEVVLEGCCWLGMVHWGRGSVGGVLLAGDAALGERECWRGTAG